MAGLGPDASPATSREPTDHVEQDQRHQRDKNTKARRTALRPGQRAAGLDRRQVDHLRNSEQRTRFLQFARSFHSYSLNNLVLDQGAVSDCKPSCGFRQWQAKARKRSRSCATREEDHQRPDQALEDPESGGGADDERVVYFAIPSVFAISRTVPIDPDDPLTIGSGRLNSEDPGITDAVTDYFTGQGWSVYRRTSEGRTVSPILDPAESSLRRVFRPRILPRHSCRRQPTICTPRSQRGSTSSTAESRRPKPSPSPTWSPACSASTPAPSVS